MDGVIYPDFKAVYFALGMLDDDKEWNNYLQEAVLWVTGDWLRQLFAIILGFCKISQPFKV